MTRPKYTTATFILKHWLLCLLKRSLHHTCPAYETFRTDDNIFRKDKFWAQTETWIICQLNWFYPPPWLKRASHVTTDFTVHVWIFDQNEIGTDRSRASQKVIANKSQPRTPGSAHSPESLRLMATNWSTGLSDARWTTRCPVSSFFHLNARHHDDQTEEDKDDDLCRNHEVCHKELILCHTRKVGNG